MVGYSLKSPFSCPPQFIRFVRVGGLGGVLKDESALKPPLLRPQSATQHVMLHFATLLAIGCIWFKNLAQVVSEKTVKSGVFWKKVSGTDF